MRVSGCKAAIFGLGGVGTSQIAIEYSYRIRHASPNTWIFWIHAGTPARFEQGYRDIAKQVGLNGWNDSQVDSIQLAFNWLNEEVRRWVIIVDNADDPNIRSHQISSRVSGQSPKTISDLFPRTGEVLFTSRNRDLAYKLVGEPSLCIEVNPMDEHEAVALLQKKIGGSSGQTEQSALELVRMLDHMPLAIVQAAVYIGLRSPRMTVARYLEKLKGGDRDRAQLLEKGVVDSRRDGQAANSIMATWHISFEHIRQACPTAAALLSLMCLFDGQSIPESLLRGHYCGDKSEMDVDFDDDIYTLASYSLVKIHPSGTDFEMHRLVQFSTKQWLELHNKRDYWNAQYNTVLHSVVKSPTNPELYKNVAKYRALLPHVQAAVSCRPRDAKALYDWAHTLDEAAEIAAKLSDYALARHLCELSYKGLADVDGNKNEISIKVLASLGRYLWHMKDFKKARELQEEALLSATKRLGEEHLLTITIMSNLLNTLRDSEQLEESLELNLKVLELHKRINGPEHPQTLVCMTNLAVTYTMRGRLDEAIKLQQEALQIRRTAFGVDPDTAWMMCNLAAYYQQDKKFLEAQSLFKEALEVEERVLGFDHPNTQRTLGALSKLERFLKRKNQK